MAGKRRSILVVLFCLVFPSKGSSAFEGEYAEQSGDQRTISFRTREATHSHVDVHPNGREIAYDLLGDIYRVGANGGTGVSVTHGTSWDWMPRYSPDGKWIAFMSDRGGSYNLWLVQRNASNLVQITERWDGEIGPPVWEEGGALLVPSKAVLNHAKDSPKSGVHQTLELPAGLRIGVRFIDQLYMTRETGELHPRWSKDRQWKAWIRASEAGWELVARNGSNGAIVKVADRLSQSGTLSFQDQVPSFSFSADGRAIVLWQNGELRKIGLIDGANSTIPVQTRVTRVVARPVHRPMRVTDDGLLESRTIRWPVLVHARNSILSSVFGKIYETKLLSGESLRVTESHEFEFSPAVSPDGKSLVYASWDDQRLGDIVVRDLATGVERRITEGRGRYINPVWSPDSKTIAYVDVGLDSDLSGQTDSLTIYTCSLINGSRKTRVITLSSPENGGERAYPVPTFAPDGSGIFVPGGKSIDAPGSRGSHFLYFANSAGVKMLGAFPHSDEALVSPDGTKLMVVRNGKIRFHSISAWKIDTQTSLIDLPSLVQNEFTPVHVSWLGNNDVSWAEGRNLYRANISYGARELVGEVSVQSRRRGSRGSIAIVNSRIITMRGDEVIESGSIVVRDGRIEYVGPRPSPTLLQGVVVIDGRGKTIIPGLMDVHAHVFNNSPREIWQRQSHRYVASLAYGVTTIFDPATPTLLDPIGQAEMIAIGEMVGPRLFSSGPAIMGEGRRSQLREISKYADASRLINDRSNLLLGPLKEYGFPNRLERTLLADAARRRSIPITAEGRDLVTNLSIITDGYTAIEHPIDAWPLKDDLLKFIVESQVSYTPILVTEDNGLPEYFTRKWDFINDMKFRRFTPSRYISRMSKRRGAASSQQSDYTFEQNARDVAKILMGGGLVTTGTHGVAWKGVHFEMKALVLGGSSPIEALRAATFNSAKKLDIDADLGSLETGKIADFLVLSKNPLDDISNTESVEKTVKGGIVFDSESMTEIWPEFHPLQSWPWQNDLERSQFMAPRPPPLLGRTHTR